MAKYESYKVGNDEFDYVSFPIIVTRHAYHHSDLPLTIPVDTGKIIIGVGHQVSTAFSGGTPSLDIGDGTTTNFWMTTTVLGPTSTGFKNSLTAIATGAVTGTVADKVVITGSTELTAGDGALYIFALDLNTNWRTTGQW